MLKPGDKIVINRGSACVQIVTVTRVAKLSAATTGSYPYYDRVTLYQYPNPATPEELAEAERIIAEEGAKRKKMEESWSARTEDPKYKLAEQIIGDGSVERFQELSLEQLQTIEGWLGGEAKLS